MTRSTGHALRFPTERLREEVCEAEIFKNPRNLNNSQLAEEEGVVEGDLFEVVVAAAGAAVAGFHVGDKEERVRVGFEGAKFGHVLCRFPVHDLAVIE